MAVVRVIVPEVLLWRSRAGIRLIATTSREDAAFVAGIATGRVRFFAYLFCGFMAGIAGLQVGGAVVGVFFAACLRMILQNAMSHLQVSVYWQNNFTGFRTLIATGGYANAARLRRDGPRSDCA